MLHLREFREEDFAYLKNWITDEGLCRQWCANHFRFPLEDSQLKEYLVETENSQDDFAFTAVDDIKGEPVGHIGISIIDREAKKGWLKFVLIGESWNRGKGMGRALVQQAVRFGFEELGLDLIGLKVFSFNKGAIQCYTKAGFEESKKYDKWFHYKEDIYWDCLDMMLNKEQWRHAKVENENSLEEYR